MKLADQLGRHRVQLVGPVERDEPHAFSRVEDEHRVHARKVVRPRSVRPHLRCGHVGRPRPRRRDAPSPDAEEVSDGIFAYVQLDGSWCLNNTGFLVGRDGVTAIDTCADRAAHSLVPRALGEVTSAPVRALVNTHHHGDHTHGNWLLPAASGRRSRAVPPRGARRPVRSRGLVALASTGARSRPWPPFVTFDDHLRVGRRPRGLVAAIIGPAHTTNDVVAWIARIAACCSPATSCSTEARRSS